MVRIRNVPFKVVGVLEKKGGNTMGSDQDDIVVTPYTTVMKRLIGTDRHRHDLRLGRRRRTRWTSAQEEIEALLRQRQRIGPGQDDDFMMRSQEEIASARPRRHRRRSRSCSARSPASRCSSAASGS